ncbi:GerMN domain-containing protein [uncultured Cetobacterium sp.]|uniref:GerMN domain-containing protein n=1 Tax=uncultured Cetobacterium sp. TaxID=527638 RepID=UPI00260E7B42|nr:GerMN domain-containing protein [uncultured Cetobacterium sp.]
MCKKVKIFLAFLIIVTVGTGFYSHKLNVISTEVTPITAPKVENLKEKQLTTTIYFPNLKENKLNTEEIIIPNNLITKEGILTNIINQLIKKLKSDNTIKEGIYKFEIYSKNKNLYLDLDSKILLSANNPQEELLIIYSFVNSLLSPGGADKVILLIDGDPTKKVNFINISNYYRKNSDI